MLNQASTGISNNRVFVAKHLPPERRVPSRKESLETGTHRWEGSHKDAKDACQGSVWKFARWRSREGGKNLTPF